MVLKHDCVRYIYSISFVVIIGRLDRRDHFYFHSLGVFEQQMQHRLTSGLSSVGTLKHNAHTSIHIQSLVAVKEIYYIFLVLFCLVDGGEIRRQLSIYVTQHNSHTYTHTSFLQSKADGLHRTQFVLKNKNEINAEKVPKSTTLCLINNGNSKRMKCYHFILFLAISLKCLVAATET